MHPYVTHLLEDIENAKRPGFSDNQPFFSNVEPEDSYEANFNDWDGETESRDVDTIQPNEEANKSEDVNSSFNFFEDDDEDLDDDLSEHFAEVERYVSEYPPNSFGDYCGLKVTDFPPAEQLTVEDMQIIIEAFEKMSFTWNIGFSIPKTLPTYLHYKIMVNTLSEKTMLTKYGFVTFDYCSGCPEGCIFGEYCNCLKYWQEDT